MVSGAEIRKARQRQRKQRRAKAAEYGAFVLAIALAIFKRIPSLVLTALVAIAALLIFALVQLPWVVEARPTIARVVRTTMVVAFSLAVAGVYGWFVWPPPHRHDLSSSEKARFEEPLKANPSSNISIQLACPTDDETDCVYASNLIPLFGEAGWNVMNQVDRVTLTRPLEGIVFALHSTTNYIPKKWNEGVWTKMPLELMPLRQAFVNIGIEPDSTSGFSVPENQIIVYVGPARENESDPTGLTQTVLLMERTQQEGKLKAVAK